MALGESAIRSAAGVIANAMRRSEIWTDASLSMRVLGHVPSLDLGRLGYRMVAVALLIWPGAAILWQKRIQPQEGT